MQKVQAIFKDYAGQIELGIRIALFIASLTFGMFVLLVGVKQVAAADLKPDTVLTDDYIRLGDIFSGVQNADYVLGPAPQPGKDMILNDGTLYKIASALDVDWKPTSSTDQIILRRDAVVIPEATISNAVETKIKDQGVDENFTMIFTNQIHDLSLPAGTDETIEITAFRFDPHNDVFNAVVVAPSSENPIKRISLSGRIERLVSIPVLKNSLKSGDIIGANDIDFIEMPNNKINNGMILKEQDLINMTPRRTISAGKPVIVNDLDYPKMVGRGDDITLIFEQGPMVLTVKGKSLQDGAMGDSVRVTNLDSNKNLSGTVTADREVTIR